MKYTFLLPAYKGAFLREALRSIVSQSYRDFKVLISDDCSLENLKSIVDEFHDSRITYRCNEENMGGKNLVSHWNMLVDLCDTEWLIMASDDDVYEPTFLEEIDKLQCKYPQIDLLRARVRRIDGEGDLLELSLPAEEFVPQTDYVLNHYTEGQIQCVANYAFRTSALKKTGGFVDYPLAWWSDVMTTMLLAENGVATTHDILFSFRSSGLNISRQVEKQWHKRGKLMAAMSYDRDVRNLLARMDLTSTKLLQCNYYRWWIHHREEMLSKYLLRYSGMLTYVELIKTQKEKREYLNHKYHRYQFIKNWIVFRLKNVWRDNI